MGIFDRLKQEFTGVQQSEVRTVIFDADWQDSMEVLKQEILGKNNPTSLSIEIPDELFEDLDWRVGDKLDYEINKDKSVIVKNLTKEERNATNK